MLLAPAALFGCFLFSSGPESEVGKTPEDLRKVREHVPPVYDAFPYGPVHQIPEGRWGRYQISQGDKSYEIVLAVTAHTDAGTWVEVEQEETVSALLVSHQGLVLEAFFLDPGMEKAVPQKILQGRETGADKELSGDRSEQQRNVEIGNQSVPAIFVEIEHEDFDGRITTESWAWSKEVPALFAGRKSGGLVSLETGNRRVRLIAFGSEYKTRIEK